MSIIEENKIRVDRLYKTKHDWLMSCAYNISKDRDIAEELVSELYLYILEKPNPAIWYNDIFNLLYLYSFLKSRFINMTKLINKTQSLPDNFDRADEVYNEEFDKKLEETYSEVMRELDNLKTSKMWASAKIAELYFFSEFTLEGLAKEIGISKSTSFLNTRKIRRHLKEVIPNPFKDGKP